MDPTQVMAEKPQNSLEDYAALLDALGLSYRPGGLYLSSGPAAVPEDRVVYISVIQSRAGELLKALLPMLGKLGLGFRLAKNKQVAGWIQQGRLGYPHIGKVAQFFVPAPQDMDALMEKLLAELGGFSGPDVPGMKPLGGPFYLKADPPAGLEAADQQEVFSPRVFGGRYLALSVLKRDAKGDVFAGLYPGKYFIPARCVIKQGRRAMCSDDAGRDMADRLSWQYQLHQGLRGLVPVPRAVALFCQQGSHYFVSEFIKGDSLENVLAGVYRLRSWPQLPAGEKISLMQLLLQLLEVVERLHGLGYLHRDLSPANFRLGTNGKLYLMDFELAYDRSTEYPLPAFGLGTPGFMSPEQKRGEQPALAEDLYGMAAVVLGFFTGMPPLKFDLSNSALLPGQLEFFTGEKRISGLVARGLGDGPTSRPGAGEYRQRLKEMTGEQKECLKSEGLFKSPGLVNIDELKTLIRGAFAGLVTLEMTTGSRLFRALGKVEPRSANFRMAVQPAVTLEAPVTGLLWLMARGAGHYPDGIEDILKTELGKHSGLFLADQISADPGLFRGLAARALALHCAGELGYFPGMDIPGKIARCFEHTADGLDLASGAAGQLLAALLIDPEGASPGLSSRMHHFAERLRSARLKDGSWPLYGGSNGRQEPACGLAEGMAGIVLALIRYNLVFPSAENELVIKRGLDWLGRHALGRNAGELSLGYGRCGIALVFLHAFEQFKGEQYRDVAQSLLLGLPQYGVHTDFSLLKGLSGWGLVYAEAYRVTLDHRWLERAGWVSQVLKNTIHVKDGALGWNMTGIDEQDGSLLGGTAGILFFLLCLDQLTSKKEVDRG